MLLSAVTGSLVESAAGSPASPSSSSGVVLASVFDTVNSTTLDAKTAMITVAGAVAVFYILHKAIRSGMALTAIAVSLLTAGLLLWGVSNTSWWQKQVGQSFNEDGAKNATAPLAPGTATHRTSLV